MEKETCPLKHDGDGRPQKTTNSLRSWRHKQKFCTNFLCFRCCSPFWPVLWALCPSVTTTAHAGTPTLSFRHHPEDLRPAPSQEPLSARRSTIIPRESPLYFLFHPFKLHEVSLVVPHPLLMSLPRSSTSFLDTASCNQQLAVFLKR